VQVNCDTLGVAGRSRDDRGAVVTRTVSIACLAVALLAISACGGGTPTSSPSATQTSKADLARERCHLIEVTIQAWSVDHHDRFPDAQAVSANGTWRAVGMEGRWPQNPWTGQPMAQGTGPGDFTFTLGGGHKTAELVLYGENGEALWHLSYLENGIVHDEVP
jgi:hypothetical protein